MMARVEGQFNGVMGLTYLLKKKGFEVVESVEKMEFLNAATESDEFDLIILLCEFNFLVPEIIGLPEKHTPIVCIDIFETEFELQEKVPLIDGVYLQSGLVGIEDRLALINKALGYKKVLIIFANERTGYYMRPFKDGFEGRDYLTTAITGSDQAKISLSSAKDFDLVVIFDEYDRILKILNEFLPSETPIIYVDIYTETKPIEGVSWITGNDIYNPLFNEVESLLKQ